MRSIPASRPRILVNSARHVRRICTMTLNIPLDATDEAILRALQIDGRRSFRAIAREVGVSEGTVRSRVRKLEQLGALRVIAFVDPARLGNSVLAILLIRAASAQREALIEELCNWSEVTYVTSLIGRADILVQIMCPDNDELGRIITRTRGLLGVIEIEPMLEVDVHKFSYSHVKTHAGR